MSAIVVDNQMQIPVGGLRRTSMVWMALTGRLLIKNADFHQI